MTNTTRLVRGIAVTALVVVAIVVAFWLVLQGSTNSGQSEPNNPSTTLDVACSGSSEECFQTVTVLRPTVSSAQSGACKGADVTAVLNSSMTSETMQIDELTFSRNAERIVVDVPADIEITTIIVGGVGADVQGSAAGLYKTTFLLPKYSWGGDSVITVCLG